MIVTKQLKDLVDFESLKKGDVVAVEWRRDVPTNKRGTKKTRFSSYEIVDNLTSQTEIILQKSMNIYFNYMMFLDPENQGWSNVRSITLITATDTDS